MLSGNENSGSSATSCRVVSFNEGKISALRAGLPSEGALKAEAKRHKALGHPSRLAVLAILKAEPCCVCDLANVLGLPLSTLSQHLKTLRQAGLVTKRQEGKLVFYSRCERPLGGAPAGETNSRSRAAVCS